MIVLLFERIALLLCISKYVNYLFDINEERFIDRANSNFINTVMSVKPGTDAANRASERTSKDHHAGLKREGVGNLRILMSSTFLAASFHE